MLETVAKCLEWDVLCVFNNFVGGQIHSAYHSATFSNGAPTVLVFGVPLWYDVKTPRVIIQVGLQKLMRQSKDSASLSAMYGSITVHSHTGPPVQFSRLVCHNIGCK